MWINQLTIAIVEEDISKIEKLMNTMPDFETQEEMKSALSLIKEGHKLVLGLRNELSSSMDKMKQNIAFLKVTESKKPSTFDIKS